MRFRNSPARGPAVAAHSMIATSQVSASLAGLAILESGGNAVDAAIAAAAVLCVSEPMSTGIGGDAFAIVSDASGVYGMDASGPAPRSAPSLPLPKGGPTSSVVPGAVAGWDALIRRFGRMQLDSVLTPAVDIARTGVAAGYHCATAWQRSTVAPKEFGPAPQVGSTFTMPDLGRTLRKIADEGPDGFYKGAVARAIAEATWIDEEDLEEYEGATWVTPLSTVYRGHEVLELPPPTQGIAALEALALLDNWDPTLSNQVRAVSLALEDAFRFVRDGADVSHLLTPEHLARRREASVSLAPEFRGGTVYLCCVDGDGMSVSFIQSIFGHFGSGVVAPGTGVVMNNRAECFEIGGEVFPGRRPYHTIIPGMMRRNGVTKGPFGVMGGYIQAQAHVQLVSSLVDRQLDPQAALDLPRFRLDSGSVRLEEGMWSHASELAAQGWDTTLDSDRAAFGGGQVILIEDDHLIGGSDPRKDGTAIGL